MSVGIYIAPANFVFMVVNHKFSIFWAPNSSFRSQSFMRGSEAAAHKRISAQLGAQFSNGNTGFN
jgi:hypothetical protein